MRIFLRALHFLRGARPNVNLAFADLDFMDQDLLFRRPCHYPSCTNVKL